MTSGVSQSPPPQLWATGGRAGCMEVASKATGFRVGNKTGGRGSKRGRPQGRDGGAARPGALS